MTRNQGKAKWYGVAAPCMKEISLMIKNMDKVKYNQLLCPFLSSIATRMAMAMMVVVVVMMMMMMIEYTNLCLCFLLFLFIYSSPSISLLPSFTIPPKG